MAGRHATYVRHRQEWSAAIHWGPIDSIAPLGERYTNAEPYLKEAMLAVSRAAGRYAGDQPYGCRSVLVAAQIKDRGPAVTYKCIAAAHPGTPTRRECRRIYRPCLRSGLCTEHRPELTATVTAYRAHRIHTPLPCQVRGRRRCRLPRMAFETRKAAPADRDQVGGTVLAMDRRFRAALAFPTTSRRLLSMVSVNRSMRFAVWTAGPTIPYDGSTGPT